MVREEQINAIESLRKALKEAGYYSFQVDEIIREIAGTQELTNLSDAQLDEVATALEERLEFAKRCLKSTRAI